MITEELNAIIAKAEGGDVAAMNRLTHIYGEVDGFINHEQSAKWFLELIKRDCDPNSGVYESTGYNKELYAKIKSIILNSTTEEEMMSAMSGDNGGSLLGGAISFTTSSAKSYINQAEAVIQRNIAHKEEQNRIAAEEEEKCRRKEEDARKKAEAEAELARRKAEEEKFENWAKRRGIVDYKKYINANGDSKSGSLTYSEYKNVRKLYMRSRSYRGVLYLDKSYALYYERLMAPPIIIKKITDDKK